MLRELRIKNFAIIDTVEVSFSNGLNILTGETGAGKSIIIGALGLVLGQRAYTEMIRSGSDSASVEALFTQDTPHPLLEHLGIAQEKDNSITIRRVLAREGKTRAFINDTAVNVQTLAELGRTLVDIHGQHEHQSLINTEHQLMLLDAFGKLDDEREHVGQLHTDMASTRRLLEDLRLGSRDRARKIDLLSFQVQEIDEAALSEGEDARLEAEVDVLSNLTRLRDLVEEAYDLLYSGEGAVVERLSRTHQIMQEMAGIDDHASEALGVIEQAVPLAEEAALSIRDLRERYELDPSRLDEAIERLDLMKRLKKKYGDTIEGILAFRNESEEELRMLENADENTERLEGELDRKMKALLKAAADLSARRRKSAEKLAKELLPILKGLAFDKCEFTVGFTETDVTHSGVDAVEFLFSANAGEPPKALHKVASGGELSRIMLALKTVLRSVDHIGTLVFDEVDAGIGGKTAHNVGARLRESAAQRQVLCITHLAQIAARADAHYLIDKQTRGKGVGVDVLLIEGERRQEEIARMLSGTVTNTSLSHAIELLK